MVARGTLSLALRSANAGPIATVTSGPHQAARRHGEPKSKDERCPSRVDLNFKKIKVAIASSLHDT
jgi:hypothetical protein